jgi:glycosyltransferase involved in cell wall biosynthesis
MDKYSISVVIPTYNPQEYLYECLSSIKKQTFQIKLFEILIILNGKKEPWFRNIEKYIVDNFSGYNISLIYTDVKGVSNARNIGIENANGKYIAFIDDDDLVSERYLEAMYDIAQHNIMPLSYLKAFKNDISNEIDDYITKLYEKNISRKIDILNTRSYFSVPYCKLIDKDIIANRRFDKRFQTTEDGLFMFAISDKINNIQFTDRSAIYYRRVREHSLSTTKTPFLSTTKNYLLTIIAFTIIYIKHPQKYNFFFYISRILATVRSLLVNR